ncbi:beta-lactamase domain-containing protein [Alkalidesulfovibrio alkalitolerans DSM 16529]|uniref:Beta-lactamase domain-containing protein n=1 Tax=Alkalidesulfovibrio alkalitolerans DSM 16529 TaxID=1121439 RepID=S7TBB4_9BACT|nr:MBL fold metallo-hydrolase [Alkalidesulfovibrio alkalitolerans]EPR34447.1 beta-lactamase domain-containing protein [Alkalidesulfovibrio alkalitolerans DSM 16529]
MRICFCGVGEAVDERLPNTSLYCDAGPGTPGLLLDCGFTGAHALFAAVPEAADTLIGVWISHFHGDHWFGLPALLVRLHVDGRTAPLHLIGQPGVRERVETLVPMAYGILPRLAFPLVFHEAAPGASLDLGPFTLSFALAGHPEPALAVRVQDAAGASAFYSGDGRPTPESLELARGASLVVHEAFSLHGEVEGHGTVVTACAFAREAGAKALAVVHVRREERHARAAEIREMLAAEKGLAAFMPEPGDWREVRP